MGMSCFQFFVIINNAVMSVLVMAPGAHVLVSGYTPNSEIVGSQEQAVSSSVLSSKLCQFILPPAAKEFPLFHAFINNWYYQFLMNIQWYFFVVLFCIP